MTPTRTIVCGIDVHKKSVTATLLDRLGHQETHQFSNSIPGILSLHTWLTEENCDAVAFESTGNHWFQLYEGLSSDFQVEVANAYHIKHFPGKKTDTLDSVWIAQLCLNEQISPSRILQGESRDFRSLTRYREDLVKGRTVAKNRIHAILDGSNVRVSILVTDIFGKSGMIILHGLGNGESVDAIIQKLPLRMKKKERLIREAISASLNQTELFLLKSNLHVIEEYTDEIAETEKRIMWYVQTHYSRQFAILQSVPGIGSISAAVLLAEIGDITSFSSGSKLAAWAGLVSSIYQSAGKLRTGAITKQGNSHLRWIAVEIAHGCAKKKGTQLEKFCERVKQRGGYKKAMVALARKILTLIWHLLIHDEFYKDEGCQEKQDQQIPQFFEIVKNIGVEEAIELIQKARCAEQRRGVDNQFSNVGGD